MLDPSETCPGRAEKTEMNGIIQYITVIIMVRRILLCTENKIVLICRRSKV